MTKTTTPTQTLVPIEAITTAANVRGRGLGDVAGLAASIEAVGLLNPLTVRLLDASTEAVPIGARVELVAGHRRLEALRRLGWTDVPVVYLGAGPEPGPVERLRLATQLVENLQREDLDPLDEAEGLAQLVEVAGSQKAAADLIGRSAAHLSKRLKLRELPDEAKAAVRSGDVTLETAFELSKLDDKAAAKVAQAFVEAPGRASYDLADAKRKAERAATAEKAAKAYAREHPKTEVSAKAKGGWKTIEGWNGLDVDQDDHEAEPCHRVVVGFAGRWDGSWDPEPRPIFYCADPGRHDPEGDSELKSSRTAKAAEAEAREAKWARERERQEAEDAERFERAATVAGGLSDRNTALKVLARFIIGDGGEFVDTAGPEVLTAIGVKVPEQPHRDADRDTWKAYAVALDELTEGLSVAQLYRAAVLSVLRMTAASPAQWQRQTTTAQAIAALVGLDPEDKETP